MTITTLGNEKADAAAKSALSLPVTRMKVPATSAQEDHMGGMAGLAPLWIRRWSYLRSTMRHASRPPQSSDDLAHLSDKLDRLGLNAVGVARIFGPHVRLLCKMHEIW